MSWQEGLTFIVGLATASIGFAVEFGIGVSAMVVGVGFMVLAIIGEWESDD